MFVQCVCDHNCRHLHVYLFTTLEGVLAEGPSWRQVEGLGGRGRREGGEGEGEEEERAEMEVRKEGTRKDEDKSGSRKEF